MEKKTLENRGPALAEIVDLAIAGTKRISEKIVSGNTDEIKQKSENLLAKNISNSVNAIKTEIFLYKTLTDKS